MILILHRRYPDGRDWEIDPEPIGTILINDGEYFIEMNNSSIKSQISKVLNMPLIFIEGAHGCDGCSIKTVERDSMEYTEALIAELRKLGLEARLK